MNCLSMVAQIVAVVYHSKAHLTGFTGVYASKVAIQQNLMQITPEKLRVFFGYNHTASFY